MKNKSNNNKDQQSVTKPLNKTETKSKKNIPPLLLQKPQTLILTQLPHRIQGRSKSFPTCQTCFGTSRSRLHQPISRPQAVEAQVNGHGTFFFPERDRFFFGGVLYLKTLENQRKLLYRQFHKQVKTNNRKRENLRKLRLFSPFASASESPCLLFWAPKLSKELKLKVASPGS